MDATGEVLTVLGPSGFGKSTLRRRVGVVLQAAALLDGTVLDDVLYGPRLRARTGALLLAVVVIGGSTLATPGLMQRLSGMPADAEYGKSSLLAMYSGAVAEQFVGPELGASLGDQVYCWLGPQKTSSAEVDYLVTSRERAIPIEVKSGPAGHLRSLHMLLKEYP